MQQYFHPFKIALPGGIEKKVCQVKTNNRCNMGASCMWKKERTRSACKAMHADIGRYFLPLIHFLQIKGSVSPAWFKILSED